VLRGENAAPRVAAKFYKAVVQSVLLYGSEPWNLTETMLARLEGFHIRAAYRMARKHKPHKGLFGNWIYPSTKDLLEECGLHSMKEYINTRRATIAMYFGSARKGNGGEGQCCAGGGENRSSAWTYNCPFEYNK
jgi:hypothetical protein